MSNMIVDPVKQFQMMYTEPDRLALPCEFRFQIQLWRKANGIKIKELAEIADVAPITMTAILNGHQMCGYSVVRRLVAFTGVEFKIDSGTIRYHDDSRQKKMPKVVLKYEDVLKSIPSGVIDSRE